MVFSYSFIPSFGLFSFSFCTWDYCLFTSVKHLRVTHLGTPWISFRIFRFLVFEVFSAKLKKEKERKNNFWEFCWPKTENLKSECYNISVLQGSLSVCIVSSFKMTYFGLESTSKVCYFAPFFSNQFVCHNSHSSWILESTRWFRIQLQLDSWIFCGPISSIEIIIIPWL